MVWGLIVGSRDRLRSSRDQDLEHSVRFCILLAKFSRYWKVSGCQRAVLGKHCEVLPVASIDT